MSTHNGHRQRMKERFLKGGLDSFHEHEALELLLYYCVPRRDTNEIAHNLCERFGSLSKAVEAPIAELKKVDGVGEAIAVFLTLVREFCSYYQIRRFDTDKPLNDIHEIGEYLKLFFANEKNEAVYLLCMDAKMMTLGCEKISEGSVNYTSISIRRILEIALSKNATYAVLAHNHPSGIAIPSVEDIDTTHKVRDALQAVDVILYDHIVVADNDCVSLRQSRQLI